MVKSMYDKQVWVFGHGLLPVFNLVRPLHIIDVHTDLVVDFGRQLGAVARIDIGKHDSGPESLVVQKPHGLIDQPLFICYRLQFVEVHALRKRRGTFQLSRCRFQEANQFREHNKNTQKATGVTD